MLVVLALGNPGARYAATRHNIGWLVADALAEKLGTAFRPAKGDYYEASARIGDREILLVKPTTYMNNSGIAAAQIAERHGVIPSDMLVLVDEIQFPVGRVQLKSSGSSGGHNGVESLIYHLGTLDIPRLRCGVGKDFGPGEMVDYVLAPFPPAEQKIVQQMIANARDAVLIWVGEGTSRAMNRINTRADASGDAPGTPRADPGGGPKPRDDGERVANDI
jgi:PTH1 family peptidyl-tRNA hydrolase